MCKIAVQYTFLCTKQTCMPRVPQRWLNNYNVHGVCCCIAMYSMRIHNYIYSSYSFLVRKVKALCIVAINSNTTCISAFPLHDYTYILHLCRAITLSHQCIDTSMQEGFWHYFITKHIYGICMGDNCYTACSSKSSWSCSNYTIQWNFGNVYTCNMAISCPIPVLSPVITATLPLWSTSG